MFESNFVKSHLLNSRNVLMDLMTFYSREMRGISFAKHYCG